MVQRTVRIFVVACIASSVAAVTPLVDKHYSYPNGIPYRVDPDASGRGPQFGYNQCNSSTEGQSSLCQTAFLNSVDDFCLWAPPNPGATVGDAEGEMVAWCTKPGRGTRVIPSGAITGVQFTHTPDYVQVVGFIDQTKIDMAAGDSGGEMDPHGADLRGNPLGGLVYSTAYTGGFEQVIEWHNFMGSDTFCFKACDPSRPNAAKYCQHIYDRIGCAYNAPSNAQPGMFQSCKGDSQDFPGVYTNAQGKVVTYTQPPENLGPITSMPYNPKVPASSDCVSYNSAALFAGGVSAGSGGGGGGGSPVTTTGNSNSAAATSAISSGSSSPSNSSPTATVTNASSLSTLTATSQSTTLTPAPSASSAPAVSSASSAPTATKANAALTAKGTAPLVPLVLYLVLGVAVLW